MSTIQNPNEADLLLQINREVPSDMSRRYDKLIWKRRSETLTLAEQNELLNLTDQVEQLQLEQVSALASLARLRQISLSELMTLLEI